MIEIHRVATADALAAARDRLRLGTLTTMLAAQNLYASLGFRPIPPYRGVEFGDTLFYELDLGTPVLNVSHGC